MDYQGEHLLFGQLGHFAAVLSFVASIVATFAYFKATQTRAIAEVHNSWKKLARTAFVIETVAVVSILFILYIIIYNHYFEYQYAYKHSKRSLPVKYLLSCFWEGQEGSFMLWNLWHCVIGLILIRTGKLWEAPVMTVLSFGQVFMSTFLLGIYFFDIKLGSSPFVLMRNEFPDAPVFKDPLYLRKYLRDGNGLNILLQNYWMVIHPPIVFIGFASSIVPFSFAIAGLWTRQYKEWIKPALPWTLFNAAALGIGIMMGAAWAYESLTFGGYWAWDPVENASLVPWLIVVAALHIMLVNQSTGHSSKSVYWFLFLSFLSLLYSTFLTRTGVLGDTSVHSFTGDGNTLYWHLIILMTSVSAVFFVAYFKRRKEIPVQHKEEDISSREFWMFVGALIFLISSGYITFYTSLPLINKIFGTQKAIGEDPEYVYNRVMILIAVVLGMLTAIIQYLKYKNTPRSFWLKRILAPTVIALVLSLLVSFFGGITYINYGAGYLGAIHVAIFASFYAIVANLFYIWVGTKGRLRASGGSIAHVGFGMVLLGILISSSKKEVVSINRTGIVIPGLKDPKGRDDSGLQNVTLIQGVPTPLSKYIVTYQGDTTYPDDEKLYFKVNYVHKDSSTGKILEEFNLYPDAFLVKEGDITRLSANPSSKHYWHKDIFTFVTSMPDPGSVKDTATFKNRTVSAGDTVFYSNGYILVSQIIEANKNNNKDLPLVDSAWLADVTVVSHNGMTYKAQPALFAKDLNHIPKRDTIIAESLVLQVIKSPDNQVQLGVKESEAVMKYITLKAFQFPFINLLWLGVLVTTFGFLLSAWDRAKKKGKA